MAEHRDLLAIPPGRLDEALAGPRFRSPELCYRLLDHAAELAEREPAAAVWASQVAVRLAGRISRPLLQRALKDWQRLDRNLRGITRQELLATLYSDSWIDVAAGHIRHADVLLGRDEADAAEAAIREALGIYSGLGKTHLQGSAHADLVRVNYARDRFEQAVLDALQAMRCLERELAPDLFDQTVYRLSASIRCARRLKPRIATRIGEIRRQRYSRRELPWTQLRCAEGVFFLHRGQLDRALAVLRRAPARLLDLGALRDATLATLDLIDSRLAEEIRDDAVAAARETLAALRSRGAEPGLVEPIRRCAEALAAPGSAAGLTDDARAAILPPRCLGGVTVIDPAAGRSGRSLPCGG